MKRIVIGCTPRTGSNLLLRSLETHPACVSGGEWFRDDRKNPDCNLLKLFAHDQGRPGFDDLVQSGVLVFLYRRDREAQLASWRRACESGYWLAESTKPERYEFPADAGDLIERSHRIFGMVADLAISYEALVANWHRSLELLLEVAQWPKARIEKAIRKQAAGDQQAEPSVVAEPEQLETEERMLDVSPCGCARGVDAVTKVIRRARICELHCRARTDPRLLPERYYLKSVGAPHVRELTAAVGPVPQGTGVAVEIGGGMSNYQAYIENRGYTYAVVDPAICLQSYYEGRGTRFIGGLLEDVELPECRLLLSAHSLEHVVNLDLCMRKISGAVESGGLAYFVLPYGPDDPCNPDHNWFFTPESLAGVLEKHDFSVNLSITKKIVPRERFIYCKATRK